MKYEGLKSYQSKDVAIVKFLQTNKQTNGQKDTQTKQKLYAPDSSMWGHKKSHLLQYIKQQVLPSAIVELYKCTNLVQILSHVVQTNSQDGVEVLGSVSHTESVPDPLEGLPFCLTFAVFLFL